MQHRPALWLALVAALAVSLSACSSTPASMRQKMQSWASAQNYTSDEQVISSDLSGIDAGLRLHDFLGVRTDCEGFYTDADSIYSSLPAPDATVTNDLNVAINTYWAPGSLACYDAPSFTAKGMAVFRGDLKKGEVFYQKAESIVHSFGIH